MLLREYSKLKGRLAQRLGLEPKADVQRLGSREIRTLSFFGRMPGLIDGTVVDIGANIGEWTAAAKANMPEAKKFICIEPLPPFYTKLQNRFAGDNSIRLVQAALSDEPSQSAQMYRIGDDGRFYPSYRSAGAEIDPSQGSKEKSVHGVRVVVGDDLLLDERPCFIKIDCDGHDERVIRGLATTLQKSRPILQFEYCEFWIAAGARLKTTTGILKSKGYSTFHVFDDHLTRFKYNPLFETYTYKNIIALPEEIAVRFGKNIPIYP